MKIQSLLVVAALTLCNSSVFASAAEDRWNSLPEERQTRLIERAAENGFDVTTEEGRQAFRDFNREARIAEAAELGFDLTTSEGREAFREQRQAGHDENQELREQQRELRREQIAELSDDERAQLREEMEGLTREERRELLSEKFGS